MLADAAAAGRAGGDGSSGSPAGEVLDWEAAGLAQGGLAGLERRLAAGAAGMERLVLQGIPNRRVALDAAVLALLEGGEEQEDLGTLADLRRAAERRLAAVKL